MKSQQLSNTVPPGDSGLVIVRKFSPEFSRNASAEEMITAVVSSCLSQILHNASELADRNCHPEHIHQLRVGIRRLRTAMRDLDGLTDAMDPSWETVLAQTFRVLGQHRDHSYLMLVLQPQLIQAGGPTLCFDHVASTIPDIGNTIHAPKFQNALVSLAAFVHRELPPTVNAPGSLKKKISKRLNKLHTHAMRDGKRFLALAQEQQHDVRKRFKRLRYMMEFCAPLFSKPETVEMTAAIKPVLDALGLCNDERMALRSMRDLAISDSNALFGVGWLTARGQSNTERCLKEIKIFSSFKPFWQD